jgi:hypothetical protein
MPSVGKMAVVYTTATAHLESFLDILSDCGEVKNPRVFQCFFAFFGVFEKWGTSISRPKRSATLPPLQLAESLYRTGIYFVSGNRFYSASFFFTTPYTPES